MSKPCLCLTLGDPAGIGPEIVVRLLSSQAVLRQARLLILGHRSILKAAADRLGLACELPVVSAPGFEQAVAIYEPVPAGGRAPRPGRWTPRTGRLSLAYVEAGIQLCVNGTADALVTGPICKAAWGAAGCSFPGHTELLAARTACDDEVMMLIGGELRVALVTVHEPLSRVPRLVTKERIVKVASIVNRDLRERFGLSHPRLAILGLNPHAGEEGRMGSEEEKSIRPAVEHLRRTGVDAHGPLPADTAFHHARSGRYDAVVAMYHDQGLGPLKTVAFDSGVNVTLGLPILRTSVDHGTAFDIAGKGAASERSLVEAVRLAVKLAKWSRTRSRQ